MAGIGFVSKGRTRTAEDVHLDAARDRVRRIVDRDFGGVVSHAAEKLQVSQSQLCNFLNGRSGVRLPFLLTMSEYLSCTVDDLLGRASSSAPDTARVAGILRRAIAELAALPSSKLSDTVKRQLEAMVELLRIT